MKIDVLFLMMIGIWSGLILGISFIEAPLKFQAPGMTTELALGVGQLVFGYSNKVQLVFGAIVLIWLSFNSGQSPMITVAVLIAIVVLLLIQSLYLLPILDQRAVQIINRIDIPSSHHHLTFVAIEIAKLILLIIAFIKLYPK